MKALELLGQELELSDAVANKRGQLLTVSKSWCDRFKIIADQLRRDWPKGMAHDEPEETPAAADLGMSKPPPADQPFRGLKLLG